MKWFRLYNDVIHNPKLLMLSPGDRWYYIGLLPEKSVMTQKTGKAPRKAVYQISEYTKPETAAEKIRDKFGDEFAFALGTLLVSPQ